MSETEQAIRKRIVELLDKLFEATMGGPPRAGWPTAIRHRDGRFEVVEIGDDGKAIEPPAPCCRSRGVLHEPGCRMWMT